MKAWQLIHLLPGHKKLLSGKEDLNKSRAHVPNH